MSPKQSKVSPKKSKGQEAGNGAAARLTKEQLMAVLLAPHVSEKAARVSGAGNQFVFRVRTDATRTDVKQAVELMFEVKVDGVQVLNQPGKQRRFGKTTGRTQDWKKAYVRLAAGHTIDFSGGVKP